MSDHRDAVPIVASPGDSSSSDDSFDCLLDSESSQGVQRHTKTPDDLVVIDAHADLLEQFEQLKLEHNELKKDNDKKIWKIEEMARICKDTSSQLYEIFDLHANELENVKKDNVALTQEVAQLKEQLTVTEERENRIKQISWQMTKEYLEEIARLEEELKKCQGTLKENASHGNGESAVKEDGSE